MDRLQQIVFEQGMRELRYVEVIGSIMVAAILGAALFWLIVW